MGNDKERKHSCVHSDILIPSLPLLPLDWSLPLGHSSAALVRSAHPLVLSQAVESIPVLQLSHVLWERAFLSVCLLCCVTWVQCWEESSPKVSCLSSLVGYRFAEKLTQTGQFSQCLKFQVQLCSFVAECTVTWVSLGVVLGDRYRGSCCCYCGKMEYASLLVRYPETVPSALTLA